MVTEYNKLVMMKLREQAATGVKPVEPVKAENPVVKENLTTENEEPVKKTDAEKLKKGKK